MNKIGTAFPVIGGGTMLGGGATIFSPILNGAPVSFASAQSANVTFHHLAERVGVSGIIPILNEEGHLSGIFVPDDVQREAIPRDIGIDWLTLEAVRDGTFDAMMILTEPTAEKAPSQGVY